MDCYRIEESTLIFRSAVIDDCDSIERMYKKIAITDKNYNRLLKERLFEQRGGMFEISSVSDIKQRIEDENEHIFIGEIDRKTVSMLWYGLAGKEVFGSLKALEGCEKEAKEAIDLLNRNKIGCAKEIISLKSKASHIMPYILNLEIAQFFLNHGIDKMLCEVYCVDGYTDPEGYHKTDLFNRASANIVTSNGAVQIGVTNQKKVTVGCYTAYITPRIFLWNCEETVKISNKILYENGVLKNGKA